MNSRRPGSPNWSRTCTRAVCRWNRWMPNCSWHGGPRCSRTSCGRPRSSPIRMGRRCSPLRIVSRRWTPNTCVRSVRWSRRNPCAACVKCCSPARRNPTSCTRCWPARPASRSAGYAVTTPRSWPRPSPSSWRLRPRLPRSPIRRPSPTWQSSTRPRTFRPSSC